MVKKNDLPYRIYERQETPYLWAYISSKITGTKSIRCSTGKTTLDEATKWTLDFIHRLNTRVDGKIALTIDEAFARYFEEVCVHQLRPKEQLQKLNRLADFFGKEKFLNDLTDEEINYFVQVKKKSLKNSSINRYLALLSVIINTAKRKWKVQVPDVYVSQHKLKEPAERIRFLRDKDEADRLINAAPSHLKPIILTALYTGLRKNNILNLTWDEIDFDENIITVHVKDSTVEGGKVHSIPIVPQLRQLLLDIKKTQQIFKHKHVFIYHQHPIGDIKSSWKATVKKAKLKDFHFHDLRHTTATWLLKKTKNLKLVKEILGHSDIRTTMKYAHIEQDDKRDALNKVFNLKF